MQQCDTCTHWNNPQPTYPHRQWLGHVWNQFSKIQHQPNQPTSKSEFGHFLASPLCPKLKLFLVSLPHTHRLKSFLMDESLQAHTCTEANQLCQVATYKAYAQPCSFSNQIFTCYQCTFPFNKASCIDQVENHHSHLVYRCSANEESVPLCFNPHQAAKHWDSSTINTTKQESKHPPREWLKIGSNTKWNNP